MAKTKNPVVTAPKKVMLKVSIWSPNSQSFVKLKDQIKINGGGVGGGGGGEVS